MSGFVTAVRTLSSVPIPGRDADSLSMSLLWFPLVGALLGALWAGAGVLFSFVFDGWPMLIALLVLMLQSAMTGAMHLDGIADAADALFSMTSREKKLAIMKDSTLGTFGVLTLIFVLALKWTLLFKLVAAGQLILLVVVIAVARTAQVELAVTMSYARSGEGTGKAFVTDATFVHRLGAWLLALVLAAAFGPLAIGSVLLAMLTCMGLRRLYDRRIGGITGDLLGATSECVELVILLWFCGFIHQGKWIDWPWHLWEVVL
ncbi:MAG: adenosylcobinamide-GDP ribazoletransferase [Deltaproteobacteria bacterium]|nr:adenosylcobinamide-GDP ribazoletransferase [Deltaproteobacteria bacterium]